MATKQKELKDMRRPDLIIPYVAPKTAEDDSDPMGTMAGALPMVSMFLRNKMIAWAGLLLAIQAWLNETPAQVAAGKQPAYFPIGMSLMTLGIVYMPLFLPGKFPGGATLSTSGTSLVPPGVPGVPPAGAGTTGTP